MKLVVTMLSVILVGLATLILIISLFLGQELLSTFSESKIRLFLLSIQILTTMFIFLYFYYLSYLYQTLPSHTPVELVISSLLFLGSLFVITVLALNRHLLTSLRRQNASLKQTNQLLTNQGEDLKNKEKELLKTLENFYTLRIDMLNKLKKGEAQTLEKENAQIKSKLSDTKAK